MKLKVQHVMDAMIVVSQILRDQNGLPRDDGKVVPRPMSQKGRYRLTRLHTKLSGEFKIINDKRDEMIKAYDYHPFVKVKDAEGKDTAVDSDVVSENFAVPMDKMPEFTAAWKELADEEIDLDVEPIPFEQLDLGNSVDGCLTPQEFFTLGSLVKD